MKGVSVAMATFNGERYLGEQLESLCGQTVQPLELVVQDDGSTDATLRVLEDFAGRSPFPVRIEANVERRGFSDTFLIGASRCMGELIAFCDQDDVWLQEKLARCRAVLAEPEVVLAMHACRVVDEGLTPTGRTYPNHGSSRIVPRLGGDPWLSVRGMAMVFDARLVALANTLERPRSHHLEGFRMNHDEWVYLLARGVGRIALIAEPLALYRQHGANVAGAAGGFPARVREGLGTGWTYYGMRRDQALDAEVLFRELAEREDDPLLRVGCLEAADQYASLARRLEQRLTVYQPGTSARRRAACLARAARAGVYDRRGFGAAALARDLLMVALGRRG